MLNGSGKFSRSLTNNNYKSFYSIVLAHKEYPLMDLGKNKFK
jgi:hypothetical protein